MSRNATPAWGVGVKVGVAVGVIVGVTVAVGVGVSVTVGVGVDVGVGVGVRESMKARPRLTTKRPIINITIKAPRPASTRKPIRAH